MKKYLIIGWPEIQDYMFRPDFREETYFDPSKNMWAIPEVWIDPYAELSDEELKEEFEEQWYGCDIGDLEDALG